jgi:hypothetical protein
MLSLVVRKETAKLKSVIPYNQIQNAGFLVRSQHPEVPATDHLGTGFSLFPCV